MQVKAETELEFLKGGATARMWVIVNVDGMSHRYVLLSGPREDVKAYFDGQISIEEYGARLTTQCNKMRAH